jgi:2-polyprenyl-6-hydroxyphenyl methylase/3-demethylubiquinone-9 3-methyltransferase
MVSRHGILPDMMTLAEYLEYFIGCGGTDDGYLRAHWPRFRNTKARFDAGWDKAKGTRVLDVGAHWLHQSLLFALDGYQVTASDFGAQLRHPHVVRLAAAHGIELVGNDDLEHPAAFSHLPDGAFDVILFGEIIEHITFNPVSMWREFYRLLAEGGRIVVTTPNYYAAGAIARRLRRRFGDGGGIPVDEILAFCTHGHHWKEYSRRELARYFELLSPDFRVNAIMVEDERNAPRSLRSTLAQGLTRAVPQLRSRLHAEIDLPEKKRGIVIQPHW